MEQTLSVMERFVQLGGETNQRVVQLEILPGAVTRLRGETTGKFDRTYDMVERLQRDVDTLMAAHVRNVAVERAGEIAGELGLWWVRNLGWADLRDICHAANTQDLPADELKRFRLAAIVIEGADSDGETRYVVVESSPVVTGEDVAVSIRNARFLAAFTGKAVAAAVAGLRLAEGVKEEVERGGVHWSRLDGI